jgi:flavin-dependent dehydrogenase
VTRHTVTADAVVVGSGTAGLGAALQLARRGLDVVVVERRDVGQGGARWDNAVLAWQFARAGLAPPAGDEVRTGTGRTHLYGPGDVGPVTVVGSPTLHADMRRLNDRLLALGRDAGVWCWERARDLAVDERDGRVVALELTAAEPGAEPVPVRFEASLFVDASGRTGALRSQVGALSPWCPRVPADVLCTASQFSHDVADRAGAERFLAERSAEPGDGVTWVGLDGGFSALAVGVSADLDEVSVLTGAVAGGPWGSGRTIRDRFLADHPWIGAARYGGDGLIPLRRPYARLGGGGVALVGDAACQVFPAHGSGIGIGLVAGAVLAESVGGFEDPGSDAALWAYQTAFHREHGGTLAAYDAFRRLSSRIGGEGVRRMFTSGLFSPEQARSGLDQRWAVPDPAQTRAALRAYRADPGLAAMMVPGLARAGVAAKLGGAAPVEPDLPALRRWDRRVAALVGA